MISNPIAPAASRPASTIATMGSPPSDSCSEPEADGSNSADGSRSRPVFGSGSRSGVASPGPVEATSVVCERAGASAGVGSRVTQPMPGK